MIDEYAKRQAVDWRTMADYLRQDLAKKVSFDPLAYAVARLCEAQAEDWEAQFVEADEVETVESEYGEPALIPIEEIRRLGIEIRERFQEEIQKFVDPEFLFYRPTSFWQPIKSFPKGEERQCVFVMSGVGSVHVVEWKSQFGDWGWFDPWKPFGRIADFAGHPDPRWWAPIPEMPREGEG